MSTTATVHVAAKPTSAGPSTSGRGSFGRASMLLTTATLSASAANYALNLLLARWMSPSAFGDANLIVTLMLGITAIAVALQLLAAQRVSVAPATTVEHRRRLLRRAWGSGIAVAGVTAAASPMLRDMTSSASAIPFILLAAGLPCYLAQAVERGVLQGHFRFGQLAATLVAEAVTRLGVAVVLVRAGFGVVGATAGISASFVASWWWGRTCVRRDLGATAHFADAGFTHSIRTSSQRLATQATMLLLVGQIVINNGDVVIAKALFAPESAGVYSVVALVGRAIFFLSWSVVTAAFPHAARGGATVQRRAVGTVALMCTLMTVAIAAAAPALTPVVFGDEYRSAAPLFAPYAIATSLFAIANASATLDVARGQRAAATTIMVGAVGQTVLLLTLAGNATQMVWIQVASMGVLLVLSLLSSRRRAAPHRMTVR